MRKAFLTLLAVLAFHGSGHLRRGSATAIRAGLRHIRRLRRFRSSWTPFRSRPDGSAAMIRKLAFDTHKAGEDRSFPENWTPCFENGLWTFLRAHLMRTRFTYLFLRTLRTGFLPTERARTFTFPYFIIVGNILCFRQKTAL